MARKKVFIIRDWTNKICFHGKEFPSFEDAWGYIREVEPEEEAWEDYYVEEKP